MKKTLSINIGGRAFTIDDDAYQILEDYMNDLDVHFRNHPGKDEIMSDIEIRVGELLTDTKGGREIVEKAHVLKVISILGQAKEIGEESEESETDEGQSSYEQPKSTKKRKLYRDRENKVIAGVCSGLAVYFNIEAWIVRLLFVLAFFAGFSSLLAYIILALIIPYATSASDRLNMRGERVTIQTIARDVEKGLDKLGDAITDFAQKIDKNKTYFF